jgi:hypothetical protein
MKIISPKISRLVGGKILNVMDELINPLITVPVGYKYDQLLGNLIDVSSKTLITHRPVIDLIER